MYIPKSFENIDYESILNLISENPLATLISTTTTNPFISHLPIVPTGTGSNFKLIGHMAKTNPHWQLLELNPKITALFHGPNTYITPEWYAKNNVPTWNYAVVHCEGRLSLKTSFSGIVHCLKILHNHVKNIYHDEWEFWLPDDLKTEELMTSAIVGFEIIVTDIKAKFKLSQNRSAEDIAGVKLGLTKRTDDASKKICRLMNETLPSSPTI